MGSGSSKLRSFRLIKGYSTSFLYLIPLFSFNHSQARNAQFGQSRDRVMSDSSREHPNKKLITHPSQTTDNQREH